MRFYKLVGGEIVLKSSLNLRRCHHLHISHFSMPVSYRTVLETKEFLKDKTTMDAVRHYDTSWSSSTNWSIADGSLLQSVIFESSLASIAGSDQHEPALDDLTKSPLILCPTSPDSGPCEITSESSQTCNMSLLV